MKPPSNQYPAKRLKTLQPEDEDNSWMDCLSLVDDVDSLGSLETMLNPRCSSDQQQTLCSSVVKNNAQHDFSEEIPRTATQNNKISPPNSGQWSICSQPATRTLHHQKSTQASSGDANRSVPLSVCVPAPTRVSPSSVANPRSAPPRRHFTVKMPSKNRLPPSIVDSSNPFSSMLLLKYRKEPTLLTLTSYPYRIMYCNEAFSRLCGPQNTPVLGDSVFDSFVIEGGVFLPSIATFPNLLDPLDQQIVFVPAFQEQQTPNPSWTRCQVQTYPVNKQDGSKELLYFAVRFIPLQQARR